jgi:hypothetical protein
MRSLKKTGIAALVALTLGIAVLTGCSPVSTAASADCSPAALEAAKADLQTAQIAANKDGVKGTGSPDEVDALAAVQTAQAKVDQATSCQGSPATSASPEDCKDSWPIVKSNNSSNRWFFEGIAAIKDATTNEEAMAAAQDWQAKVRQDPTLLAGAAKVFLLKEIDRATLAGSDGCVTKAAVDLDLELGMALAAAKVTPDDVPETAYNSGVADGSVIGDSAAGITGDRSAIQITLPDGRVIWIMARCGNVATQGSPPLPPGPTDNPPRPTCESAYGPGYTGTWPVCKDPASNDPGPSRNAPVGGGKNADPGPGAHVAPSDMVQPPATLPVNPAAPPVVVATQAPSTPSNPTPAPVPTVDPAPAPTAEPSAAPTTAPIDTCVPPPGKTTC